MKNIIICSDGTGNSTVKARGTNVFKLYEAVDLHHSDQKQVAIYDDGVGTESLKPLKILGGAFGFGLSRNVRQLYTSLASVYEPGDRIYVFGFSRGAFTVRSLAGLITSMGIVDRNQCESDAELRSRVKQAYREYRYKNRAPFEITFHLLFGWVWLLVGLITGQSHSYMGVETFRSKYAVKNPDQPDEICNTVRFIGVWDTVSAVGFPILGVANFVNTVIYRFKFPDYKLSPAVEQGCHALAIDDKRKTFHPLLWNQQSEQSDRIEQVWFAGAHANVGGGYPKQGLSLVALDWMLRKANAAGVKFLDHDTSLYRHHRNVNDKLYNSRSGLGTYYRYAPRDIYASCLENGFVPRIHASTINRIVQGTEGYAPGNLPREFEIVDADAVGCEWPEVSETMTEVLQDKTSLLDRVRNWIVLRQLASWAFILTTVYTVWRSMPADLCDRGVMGIFGYFTSSELFSNIASQPWYLFGILLFIYLLTFLAQRRMQRIFSEFWHLLVLHKFRP
ncbi:MAG: DUF2235 domain-containing protein [Proteobacteria bacterium]|jgi:hypothetical protein|nr:DUF2235 domain-containing protein [Pseudomonadota bacterium]